MTLLFEKEPYQEECIGNILEVIDGSDWKNDPGTLKRALAKLHEGNSKLGKYPLLQSDDIRLDVMMETGTGKTFTYLKTMYELDKRGINKFLIFVPRLAIRAGIIQNIKLTADYFYREYGKRIKHYSYMKGLNEVIRYTTHKDEFSVLILTSSSIIEGTKEDNGNGRILARNSEKLHDFSSPLESISKMRPIIFIDEPHLLKGEGFIQTYRKYFNDALLLRFGATFPDDDENKLSNVVYVLDSLDAFNECLVKKIAVSTAYDKKSNIRFVKPTKKTKGIPPLTLSYFKSGVEYKYPLNYGENISSITGDKEHNFHVIGVKGKEVHLSNATVRRLASFDYSLPDDIIRMMIQQTLKLHFDKEERNLKRGIKTLSLFFIPYITDYRGDEPRIKNFFEEEYLRHRKAKLKENISVEYRNYLKKDFEEGKLNISQGYFAGDNSSRTKEQNIESGINIILNDKEKLLSTSYPLRFIFSVWALQEGWDNPNVFNICKLATTDKEIKLRQQVGRGLRLAVDTRGRRQTLKYHRKTENVFHDINLLDVVVSSYEGNFIETLQKEVIGEKITYSMITEEALIKLGLFSIDVKRLVILLLENKIIKEREQPGTYSICQPIDVFLETNKEKLPRSVLENYDKLLEELRNAKKFDIINRNRDKNAYKVGIRQGQFNKFEKLWKTITGAARVRYEDIDTSKIIENVNHKFSKEDIYPQERKIRRERYNHEKNTLEEMEQEIVLAPIDYFKEHSYTDFVKDFSVAAGFPLNFCMDLFNKLDKDKISKDPQRAKNLILDIIRETINDLAKDKISYEFKDEAATNIRGVFYEDDELRTPRKDIDAFLLGDFIAEGELPQRFYLYDKLTYDAEIELDILQNKFPGRGPNSIKVFAKLPRLSIPMPFTTYSPDFAYLVTRKEKDDLFLIIETKGYKKKGDIPYKETLKIEYAKKFFNALNEKTDSADVSFDEIIDPGELPHLIDKYTENI